MLILFHQHMEQLTTNARREGHDIGFDLRVVGAFLTRSDQQIDSYAQTDGRGDAEKNRQRSACGLFGRRRRSIGPGNLRRGNT
jgi:hypothetical protein